MGYNPKVDDDDDASNNRVSQLLLPFVQSIDGKCSFVAKFLREYGCLEQPFPYQILPQENMCTGDAVSIFAVSKLAVDVTCKVTSCHGANFKCLQSGSEIAIVKPQDNSNGKENHIVELNPDGIGCLIPWISPQKKVALNCTSFLALVDCDSSDDGFELLLNNAVCVDDLEQSAESQLQSIGVGVDFIVVCYNVPFIAAEDPPCVATMPSTLASATASRRPMSKAERKKLKRQQSKVRGNKLEQPTDAQETGRSRALSIKAREACSDIYLIARKLDPNNITIRSRSLRLDGFKYVLEELAKLEGMSKSLSVGPSED